MKTPENILAGGKIFALALCLSALPISAAYGQDVASPDGVTPLTSEEALVLDGKSYASRYNVSLAEAMRRISIMAGVSDEVDALGQELGDEVSGMYFDNGANFELKVRTTGSQARGNRQFNRRDGKRTPPGQSNRQSMRAKFQISDSEVAEAANILSTPASVAVEFTPGAKKGRRFVRDTIQANLAQVSQFVPTFQGAGYDERAGEVVVQLVGDAGSLTADTQSKISALFSVPVRFEYGTKPIAPLAARGGTQITYKSGGANCTAAFYGFDPSNRPGLFTAGHCYVGVNQALSYTDTDGKVYDLIVDPGLTLWNPKEDVLFLRFPTGLTGVSQFYGNKNEAARTVTGVRNLSTTNVKSATVQGTYICYYGMTNGPVYGQGCGTVTVKEFLIAAAGGMQTTSASAKSTYVQVQGPTSLMRCGPGDSGAPWFAIGVAFGIMSRCAENWVGTDSVAIYTSVDVIANKSYKVSF
jgi:hypothetical protein